MHLFFYTLLMNFPGTFDKIDKFMKYILYFSKISQLQLINILFCEFKMFQMTLFSFFYYTLKTQVTIKDNTMMNSIFLLKYKKKYSTVGSVTANGEN